MPGTVQDIAHTKDGLDEHMVFTFRIGGVTYGVPLEHILALTSMPDRVLDLPGAAMCVDGLVEYRGHSTALIDLAGVFGVGSEATERLQLAQELEQREQEHVAWIDALSRSIREGEPFTKARDPHECAFGRWFDGFRTADEQLGRLVAGFAAPHERIHSLADHLLGMASGGDVRGAQEKLAEERDWTLREMCHTFQKVRDHLRASSRRVVLFLTRDGSTPSIALLLDEIADVRRFGADALHGLVSDLGSAADEAREMFDGMLVDGAEGEDCVLLNPAPLLEMVRY